MNENQQPSNNNGNGRIMSAAAATSSSTTRKGMKSGKLSSSSRKRERNTERRKPKVIDSEKRIEDGKRKRTDDDQRGSDHNNSASPRNASLEENEIKNEEHVNNFFENLGKVQRQQQIVSTENETTTSSSEELGMTQEYSSEGGLTQEMAEIPEYWEESNSSSEGKLPSSSTTATQESSGENSSSLPPCMAEQKQQHQRSNVSDNSMMIQHRSHNGTQQQQLTRAGSIDSTKSRSARNKPLTADQKAMIEANKQEAKRKRMSRQSPSCNAPSAAQQHQSSSSAAMNPMSRQSPSCNALYVAQQHQSRQEMKLLSTNRSSSAGINPLQTQNVQMKRTQPNNGVAQKPMQQQQPLASMKSSYSERYETVASVTRVNTSHHSNAHLSSESPSAEQAIASDTSSEVGTVLFYEDAKPKEENVVSTNDNKKGASATLTQCWSKKDDDGSRERKMKVQTFPTQKFTVERHLGTGQTNVVFERGDVWFSPTYKDFVFLVKEIIFEDKVHKADVYAFMKVKKTFIKEYASKVPYLEWVMVTKHPDLPPNGHISLRDLHQLMIEDIPFHMRLDNVHLALRYAEDDDTVVFENARGPQKSSNNDQMLAMCEIFAGGGGMSCGAREVGISNCTKVDMDRMACKTLEANFPDATVLKLDVRDFNAKTWRRELKQSSPNDWDHFSPPCNGFSAVNTSGGRNDIQNNECTLECIETIRLRQPNFVTMENVPGLLYVSEVRGAGRTKVSYLQEFMAGLLSMDYQIRLCKRLIAKDYGDPQERERVILFAAKRGYALPEAPRPTHGDEPNLRKIVTVRDAIGDLEDIDPTEDGIVILKDRSEARGHYLKDTKRAEKHVERQDPVLQPDLPCTVTVRKHNALVHYNRKRNVTLLERARLMSFPDGFVFKGNHGEQGDQIGNAIPVKFAAAIATAVKDAFKLGLHHEPPPGGV